MSEKPDCDRCRRIEAAIEQGPSRDAREELEALDTWRFKSRMPSRASAIRELLKRGLSASGFAEADGALKSKDFGVAARGKVGSR